MERRSQKTTSAATPPIANGMRQPHSVRTSLAMVFCRMTSTSSASIWPPMRVTYWKLEKKPRRLDGGSLGHVRGAGAVLAADGEALQQAHEDQQDQRPDADLLGGGRIAIAKEPADIRVTLRVSAALRPLRSA